MRRQMIEHAAFELAAQVRAAEESIETAIAQLAELQVRMVHARGVTGAAFVASHAPFEHVATATTGLVAARGGIAGCHAALAEARKTIPGLRTVGLGDDGDCPPNQAAASLRVVA